jgi:hypothetical protein
MWVGDWVDKMEIRMVEMMVGWKGCMLETRKAVWKVDVLVVRRVVWLVLLLVAMKAAS